MSYNQEQTLAYESMMYAWGIFEDMKKQLSKERCELHGKKIKMGASWERNYDLDITLYNYCCMNFAKNIAQKFVDKELFTSVIVESR